MPGRPLYNTPRDERAKLLSASFEVAELIKARAGRREHDHLACDGAAACARHGPLELTAVLDRDAQAGQRSGDLGRVLADQIDGRTVALHRVAQLGEVLALALPA